MYTRLKYLGTCTGVYHRKHSQLCRNSPVCWKILVTFLLRNVWLLDLIELEKFRGQEALGDYLVQHDGQGRVCHEIKIRTSSCWVLKASKVSNCRAACAGGSFICTVEVFPHSIPRGILSLSVISAFCCPPEGRAWHHFLCVAEEEEQAVVMDTMRLLQFTLPLGSPCPVWCPGVAGGGLPHSLVSWPCFRDAVGPAAARVFLSSTTKVLMAIPAEQFPTVPGARRGISPGCISEVPSQAVAPACPGPSGCQPCPHVHGQVSPVWHHTQTRWECTLPPPQVRDKDVK